MLSIVQIELLECNELWGFFKTGETPLYMKINLTWSFVFYACLWSTWINASAASFFLMKFPLPMATAEHPWSQEQKLLHGLSKKGLTGKHIWLIMLWVSVDHWLLLRWCVIQKICNYCEFSSAIADGNCRVWRKWVVRDIFTLWHTDKDDRVTIKGVKTDLIKMTE